MGFSKSLCCLLIIALCACQQKKDAYRGWPHYKGSPENMHYSALTQIDTSNVQQLKPIWEYHTGDADTAHHSQIQCNPIMVDGMVYGTTPQMKLIALDAATGQLKWSFNPFDSLSGSKSAFFILNNSRGVAYWSDGKEDKRIYYTAGSALHCVNAQTGKIITTFADSGRLDLHEGLDRDVRNLFITATSPPIVYKDLLVIGSRVDEGPAAAPGHIRAFDVRTGQRRWIFHTIPHPGEAGYETWKDTVAYKYIGGANAWSGFSLDESRGILYAVTGSASFDFWGGKRLGDNLFANCLLALDAATGKRLWHFQQIHHDVWDRDFSSPPALVTVKREGNNIDAVAITTKTGFVFLFDRTNGTPLFDINETPVPTNTDLEGEVLSPTQPIPVKPEPFVRQLFTEKDINPLLPDSSYAAVKKRWQSYKHGHMFDPPSLQGTIVLPGFDGGAEWGGPAFDPETGMLYVNANEMAWILQAVDLRGKPIAKENYLQAGQRLYRTHCMSCHGANREGSGNFPALMGIEKRYSAEAFHTLVQSGRRMMPAFKQLNEQERNAIASFILNQQQESVKVFVPEPSPLDAYLKLPYTTTGYNKFLSAEGYPALSPPWGTLNALHLSSGDYAWQVALGHDDRFKTSTPTGTENYGAPVVTKGGLLFIAATKDGMLRAFNKRNGALLWEYKLPVPAFATPAVYEWKGKQYIVIACGGGKLGTPSGDSYMAFALPE